MDKKPENNPWETDPSIVVDDATADYIIKHTPLKFWHSHPISQDYEDATLPAQLEDLTEANERAHINTQPSPHKPSSKRGRRSTKDLPPKDAPGLADLATRPRTRMSPVEGLPDDWFWIDEADFTGHIQTPGPEIAEYDLHAHSICIDGKQKINPAYTPDEAGLEFMKKDALPDIKRFIAKRVIKHDKPFGKKKENVNKKSPENFL